MSDERLFFSSIHDICRPVPKEEFNPFSDEDIIVSRAEAPQFPPASWLISEEKDEFVGCRTLYNTRTGSGPVLVRHAGRGVSFLSHLKDSVLLHDVMAVVASGNRLVFPNTLNEFSMYAAIDDYTIRSHMTYSILNIGSRGEREWQHYLREVPPEGREVVIESPHVLLANMVSMSYFHFMIDIVPRLWIFDEWPQLRSLPILISPMGEKFEQVLADLIGVPRSCLSVIHPNLIARFIFKHLIYPSGLCDRMMTRERLDFIRSKTANPADLTPVKPWRRIYLTRADRPYRGVGNEEEVRDLLRGYGFEIHVGNSFTISEQAKLFNETAMLVGIGGGGFTNMLFMQPGSVVLELSQRHPSVVDGGELMFAELANLRGLNRLVLASQWDTYNLSNGMQSLCAEHPAAMFYDTALLSAAVEKGLSLIGVTD